MASDTPMFCFFMGASKVPLKVIVEADARPLSDVVANLGSRGCPIPTADLASMAEAIERTPHVGKAGVLIERKWGFWVIRLSGRYLTPETKFDLLRQKPTLWIQQFRDCPGVRVPVTPSTWWAVLTGWALQVIRKARDGY